ncbi:hypothetical protein OIU85_025361 [Salix viminalis]|uniref:Uncharacterized protein n=1 Tax=Salix viminalis TaxID=40686 RepID=A0A9Q0TLE6_SALVM|nr:hypothetical protein OIU85_025361 [Salix viminalis]
MVSTNHPIFGCQAQDLHHHCLADTQSSLDHFSALEKTELSHEGFALVIDSVWGPRLMVCDLWRLIIRVLLPPIPRCSTIQLKPRYPSVRRDFDGLYSEIAANSCLLIQILLPH